jgi:histidinol-phosphate aminotransferase
MNVLELVRENIKSIEPYSSARDEYSETNSNMVFLDANENPFENGVNRYPDPQQLSVKEQLSVIKSISSENILLGNGSDEVLDLLLRAFCEPNQDEIIILPPTYGMYKVLANINAVNIKEVQLTENFQTKTATILANATLKSKILFLCSPNNPTGNSFDKNEVEKLIKQFKGIVVIDEAYIDFSEQESWLNRLEEFPNLIITQTLSKAYGMAGIRLGICYAFKDIIKVLNAIKPPYNVNELTQNYALKQLTNYEKIKSQITELKASREQLVSDLKKISFIDKIYPSDANFLLIKVDDANYRYQQLIENKIVIRNRTNQPLCENCLRISIGTKTENELLIKTLQQL